MIRTSYFKIFLFSISILTSSLYLRSQPNLNSALKKTEKIIISIQFESAPKNLSIQKAALKFNKDFAYSFTIDDGLVSSYKVAYPLFKGGHVSETYIDAGGNDQGGDGKFSPGLFYTDGCGNSLPFTAALCVNANSLLDTADKPRYSVTWKELDELYQQGWDLLNHGFAHATKDGTDFNWEVKHNNEVVKKRLGITLKQFVIPGGPSSPGYEKLYTAAAYQNGLDVVYNNGSMGPLIEVDKPITLKNIALNREYTTSSKETPGLYKSKETILNAIQKINEQCKKGSHYWFHEFTHSVGNTNLWTISLTYDVFKYYMISLDSLYGKKGKDNMWMAPCQEVCEYLTCRDAAEITHKIAGENMTLEIDITKIPEDLRRKALTLNINSDKDFKILKVTGTNKYSYKGIGVSKLINLDF